MPYDRHSTEHLWSLHDWLAHARIGRTTEHELPPELKPLAINIGRRRLIRETPREWAARVAAIEQSAASTCGR